MKMTPLHPCHRITDDLDLRPVEPDLAFHADEKRDSHGRWADTAGRMTSDLKPVRQTTTHDADPNTKFPGEPSYAKVAKAYEWAHRDKVGSDGTNADGIRQQGEAQIHAQMWAANNNYNLSPDEQYAISIWQFYQSPDEYAKINSMLRSNKPDPDAAQTPAQLRREVGVMFDKAGYTTTKPMKVYRALKSDKIDWAEKLKPGTTFEEDGICSTTAHNQISQGWLGINPTGAASGDQREVQPNDVMMEIHLPAGTRIVGGVPEFIETMLKPGTKFKIVSSESKKAEHPDFPLGGDAPMRPFTYTHVIAEVQP